MHSKQNQREAEKGGQHKKMDGSHLTSLQQQAAEHSVTPG